MRAALTKSLLVLAVAAALSDLGCGGRTTAAGAMGSRGELRKHFASNIDSLEAALDSLRTTLAATAGDSRARSDTAKVRAKFRAARRRYKQVEAIAEFYAPALAASINSRRQEVDDDDQPPPSTLGASGFPALEDALWRTPGPIHADSAQRIVENMRMALVRLRWLANSLAPTDAQLVEVMRLELIRIATLGIAGFDTPVTGDALSESADAIDALRGLVAITDATAQSRDARSVAATRQSADARLASASAYLRSHSDFRTSDRLSILVGYLEPAAVALKAFRDTARIPPLTMPRPLRADAALPYDRNAFDARVYAPSGAPVPTPQLIALGARLFADPALSRGSARSCASCHNPSRAFTDGRTTPASIDVHGPRVARNTPTLINAALQPSQFADERATTLEDQVAVVLGSPLEMASSADAAASLVARDEAYGRAFARVFGEEGGSPVTSLRLREAVAAYVRSLEALDSRFDRAVRGDTGVLTADERLGFTLFMGKARCGTCHFAPLFSGTTPPLYHASDVEVIGTPARPSAREKLDADSGRARIDHLPTHFRAFKTPTLRNIALTAPYMHNGAFATLDEVLDFYDVGGAAGAGAAVPNQTLASDSLHLTASERRAILAFLHTLTDTVITCLTTSPSISERVGRLRRR